MLKKTVLTACIAVLHITLLPMGLLEHHNITFQKEFEKSCQNLFAHELTDNPIELAERFLNALEDQSLAVKDKPFFLGLSTSAYQVEGGIGEESSYHRFALRRGLPLPGDACDFWNNYKAIIKQLKETCHINSFRLSISWERIQKTEDSFDQEALNHYKEIIQELKRNGIEPLVVLNHYTVPTWFEDLGGFAVEKNIMYFVQFAQKVYLNLADEVTYWSTFNAIEGYAFKGYYTLDGAPGNQKDMNITVQVMVNMLKAHVEIYRAFKGIKEENSTGLWQHLQALNPEINFPEPQIGIQKNIIFLDIAYDTLTQRLAAPMTWFLCTMGNNMQNEGFYSFFNTGTFAVYVPFKVNVSYYDNMAPHTLDWIGVNTYANQKRYLMDVITDKAKELTTLNPTYRFYPQGLYRAVKEVYTKINGERSKNEIVPIWITENGIAAHSDKQRQDFFEKTLLMVTKLIEEGYPIFGYTPWAAFDNYEWSCQLGERRYGMLHVDFKDLTKPFELKKGSQFFADFVKQVNHINKT